MTQHINLFHAGLREPRPQLSFAMLLKGLGGLVALMAVIYVLVQFQVYGVTGDLRRTQEQLKVEQADALKVAGQASARKPDPQLEAEIDQVGRRGKPLLHHRDQGVPAGQVFRFRVLGEQGGSFGDRQGFAQYLRAFSRQSVEGLWLTAFTITGAGDIEISGRALRPDIVPVYIQRLNEEQVLAGHTFARFEMKRPEAPADKKPAPVAPFLEFTLGTREAVKLVEKPQ